MPDFIRAPSHSAAIIVENALERDLSVWKYHVIHEHYFHSDIGKYRTYGIQAVGDASKETLHDVSVCREVAVWMAKLFDKYQLSPIHLRDAVEDLLP